MLASIDSDQPPGNLRAIYRDFLPCGLRISCCFNSSSYLHASLVALFFVRQKEPALAFCKTRLRAADGVSNDKIIFGKVAALNGPAQAFGPARGHSRGFEDANRAGWVNGRN